MRTGFHAQSPTHVLAFRAALSCYMADGQRGAPIIAVYGHVEHTGVLREDLLCSVAKVHVPVQNDHPACASLLGCSGCHSCGMQGSAHQRDSVQGQIWIL